MTTYYCHSSKASQDSREKTWFRYGGIVLKSGKKGFESIGKGK